MIAYKSGTADTNGLFEWVFGVDEALEGLVVLEQIEVSAKNRAWQKIKY